MRRAIVAAALLSLATPAWSAAQGGGGYTGGGSAAPARRDPFVPPAELYRAGGAPPIRVTSIFPNAADPKASVAAVRVGAGEEEVRDLVRVGQVVAGYKVAEIHSRYIVVLTRILGVWRRVEIPLEGARPGASGSRSTLQP